MRKGERQERIEGIQDVGVTQQGVAAEAAPQVSYRSLSAARGPAERGR